MAVGVLAIAVSIGTALGVMSGTLGAPAQVEKNESSNAAVSLAAWNGPARTQDTPEGIVPSVPSNFPGATLRPWERWQCSRRGSKRPVLCARRSRPR